MPKVPSAPVQTVRLDPKQLAEFAKLLGGEIAAAISNSTAAATFLTVRERIHRT